MGNAESNEEESNLEEEDDVEEEQRHTVKADYISSDKQELNCNQYENTTHTTSSLHEETSSAVLTLRGIVMGDRKVGKSCLLRHLRGEDPFQFGEPPNSKKQLMALTPWKITQHPSGDIIQLHVVEQQPNIDDHQAFFHNMSIRELNPPLTKKIHPISKDTDFLILMLDPRRYDTLTYARTTLDALFRRIQEQEGHVEHLLLSICIMINFMDVIHSDVSFTRHDVRNMIQDLYTLSNTNHKEILLSIPIFIFEASMKDTSLLKSTLHEFVCIPYLQRKEYHFRQLADQMKHECIIQCKHLSSLETVKQSFDSFHERTLSNNNNSKDAKPKEVITPSLDIKRNILPSAHTKSTESSTHPQKNEYIPETDDSNHAFTIPMDKITIVPTMDLEQFLADDGSDDDDNIDAKSKPVPSFQKQTHSRRNHVVYRSDESDSTDESVSSVSENVKLFNNTTRKEEMRVSPNLEGFITTRSHTIPTASHDYDNDGDINVDVAHEMKDYTSSTNEEKLKPKVLLTERKMSAERTYVSSSDDDDSFMVHDITAQESGEDTKYEYRMQQSRYVSQNRRPSDNKAKDQGIIVSTIPNKETESAIAAAIQEATESLERETRESTANGTREYVNEEDNERGYEDDVIKSVKKNKKDKKKSKKTKK